MSLPISGFTAVPNPQMLAFMGAQSFIMMFQAGEGWQYGKRRISAMSNEDFNKLTPLRLLQNQAANLRSSISTIEKSMNDMTPMIGTIVAQYGDFITAIIARLPQVSQQVVAEVIKSIPQGGFPGEGDKKILEILKNLIPSLPSAEAQVPSGGPLTTSKSQFFGPPVPSKKLVLPPKGTNVRGFLGGPAPVPSIAQRFRQFTSPRIKGNQLLAELQRQLVLAKRRLFISRTRIRNSRSSAGYQAELKIQKRELQTITSLERSIVLQKIKIARR